MKQRRRTRTRNEIKREAIKTAIMAVALIVLWAVLTVYAIGVWAEHPGEQPVSGQTYLASIQMDGEPVW